MLGAFWPALASGAPADDPAVVANRRLPAGVPLGGIGTGGFEILSDGSFSRATFNNNPDQPTGDLPGAFAAIWTHAGGVRTARVLTLQGRPGAPGVTSVRYRGRWPFVDAEFPDPGLPVTVRLVAYTPLIPGDLRNSSLPVALLTFAVRNVARAPVEAAVAVSWENLLGVGGASRGAPFADRTGNTVTPAAGAPYPGLRFDGALAPAFPAEQRRAYNARGGYALLVDAGPREARISAAGWNALDETPGWWALFAQEGRVEGTAGPGREGALHPAGVVAATFSLGAREERTVEFAVAWHTPRQYITPEIEVGHLYEISFADAVRVAAYALENRAPLRALTAEWHGRLDRATLPPWLVHRLVNDASVLTTNSVLTRDSGRGAPDPGPSLFAMLEAPVAGEGRLGALDRRPHLQPLLAAWFPALDADELRAHASARTAGGELAQAYGDLVASLRRSPAAGSEAAGRSTPAAVASLAWQTLRAFRATGSQRLLDDMYPAVKQSLQTCGGRWSQAALPPEASDPESVASWRAAVVLGAEIARLMEDRRFGEQCAEWLRAAPAAFASDAGRVGPAAMTALWMAESLGLEGVAPPETLERLADLEERAGPVTAGAVDVAHEMTRAAWLAQRGRVDAALRIAEPVCAALVGPVGEPWQPVAGFDLGTRALVGPRAPLWAPSSWLLLEALTGFDANLPAGRLRAAPPLAAGQRVVQAPLFAPALWAWLEYRTGAARSTLTLRLDRLTGPRPAAAILGGSAGIEVREVTLPAGPPGEREVAAMVGRVARPGTAARDLRGRLVFTFDPPVRWKVGDRMEFSIR
ncbi:MAG TPA: GH116 family glycosyl-hydrolase [Chthonomonadales bacterium]|nr:GH116 family glycosyl-hydrolase [Chthonomonadales bacterium]